MVVALVEVQAQAIAQALAPVRQAAARLVQRAKVAEVALHPAERAAVARQALQVLAILQALAKGALEVRPGDVVANALHPATD